MNYECWLDQEDWLLCRSYMDDETFQMFKMEVLSQQPFAVGIPALVLKILDVCERPENFSVLYEADIHDSDSELDKDHINLNNILSAVIQKYRMRLGDKNERVSEFVKVK